MKNRVAIEQVNGQVEAQGAQVTPQVGPSVGRQIERFINGGRTFLSANKNFMAGWKTRPPLRARGKALKEILEKIGV